MSNFPTVITLPFKDGVRDVPEHLAVLLKQHQIATHEMTYDQAIERMNWKNADKAMNDQFNKIRDHHLRQYGL